MIQDKPTPSSVYIKGILRYTWDRSKGVWRPENTHVPPHMGMKEWMKYLEYRRGLPRWRRIAFGIRAYFHRKRNRVYNFLNTWWY